MRRAVVLTVALFVLGAMARAQQSPPDLSGHWVWNSERTQAVTGRTPPQPQGVVEWTITQTPTSITMIRPWPIGPAQKFVFGLDGRESVNDVPPLIFRTTQRWEGGKLIIDGSRGSASEPGRPRVGMRWVFWLTPGGDLVVESTTDLGPQRNATVTGPPGPFVQVFVKTPGV